jgi:chromosome segregation ATPase
VASPVKAAAAAVEEANARLATARQMRAALEQEEKAAERELTWTEIKLDAAVSDAVRADSATARLFAAFNEAERNYMSLRQAMGVVRSDRLPVEAQYWHCTHAWPELPDAAQWKTALTALVSDADAELPT